MAKVGKQKTRTKEERADIERRRKLKKDDPKRTLPRKTEKIEERKKEPTVLGKTIELKEPIKLREKETFFKPKTVGGALKLGAAGAALAAGGALGGAIAGRLAAGAAAKAAPTIANQIKVSAEALTRARVGLAFAKFSGQVGSIPGKAVKATGRNAGVVGRFARNPKSLGLSKSLMGSVGLTIPAASILIGAIGSYPFAGFIKEEALQTLSFATKVAIDSGDLERAQVSIDQVNEVLNPEAWEKLIGSVPYANVLKQLQDFYLAAATKNAADQRSLDKKTQIAQGNIESDFARERRVSDEAARERDIIAQEEDTERFEGIEAERTQTANEDKRLNSIYFQLLRDKKFEEAEQFRLTNFPTEKL